MLVADEVDLELLAKIFYKEVLRWQSGLCKNTGGSFACKQSGRCN
jgi:hypothetical protein